MAKLTNMTKGNIFKTILVFGLPIFLGNIFQTLYNTIDSIIVGQFVGDLAFAAVGSTNALINLLVGLFMGISSGAGVLISRYYGANKIIEVKDTIHTFISISIIGGIILSIIGVISSKSLLILFNTPDDILYLATIYLQIYFIGGLSLVLYNCGASILRAIGDSKTPLYLLILSSTINVILDLVFVLYFDMGVIGVGIATLIAQSSSAILVMIILICHKEVCKVNIKDITINKRYFIEIINIGIPSGIQQSIISLSNVFVQSYVNGFGNYVIAGYSAANKIDSYIMISINSLAISLTTYVGQNAGANDYQRVFKGINISILSMFILLIVICSICYINIDSLISLFNNNPNVIYYGSLKMKYLLPFYFILGIGQLLGSALRGLGRVKIPMYTNILSFCIIRQLYLFVFLKLNYDISIIFNSYALTWFISTLILLVYYFKGPWRYKLSNIR